MHVFLAMFTLLKLNFISNSQLQKCNFLLKKCIINLSILIVIMRFEKEDPELENATEINDDLLL